MNDKHKKKMIMPIVITVLFLVYLIVYVVGVSMTSDWLTVVFAVPLLGLGAGMVYALKSRIKEIRSGEEDDLNNY